MIQVIALLLGFQLAGTAVVTVTRLPVPGPVMGMVFFLTALLFRRSLLETTLPVVNVLLAHFALLFVPAGVGIMEHTERLSAEWLPIATALIVSTALAMLVTLWVTRAVMRLMHLTDAPEEVLP